MAAFDENSFAKNTSFSDLAFDFGTAVVAAVADMVVRYRRRRGR